MNYSQTPHTGKEIANQVRTLGGWGGAKGRGALYPCGPPRLEDCILYQRNTRNDQNIHFHQFQGVTSVSNIKRPNCTPYLLVGYSGRTPRSPVACVSMHCQELSAAESIFPNGSGDTSFRPRLRSHIESAERYTLRRTQTDAQQSTRNTASRTT